MSSERSKAYTASGVNIEAGNALVSRIKDIVAKTHTKGVISDIGGFGGLFRPDINGMSDPVLVSSTDGVGTKLKLAFLFDKHDTVGIDLVAMSVNDILVQGATPLFFLDYFATGKLDIETAQTVIAGVAEGCKQSACALLGGETAEMPDMYGDGEYDLAGFCVGIVSNDRLIDGSAIRVGDAIIGIASTGVHSNGYSLVRKILCGAICPSTAWPTSPAAASTTTFPACCLPLWKRTSTLAPGTFPLSSTGSRKQATSPGKKCARSSTQALATFWLCRAKRPRRPSTASMPSTTRLGRLAP